MSAASKLSKERNKKKKDEKLVKYQQASSYGIESWFQGLPSLQRLESRGAWGGWSWALSFNSLLRFHQLSYFLTVIVRHASYYIASFLFRLVRHSPKAKGLSSVLNCLWHQTTNLLSPILTKYLFIFWPRCSSERSYNPLCWICDFSPKLAIGSWKLEFDHRKLKGCL